MLRSPLVKTSKEILARLFALPLADSQRIQRYEFSLQWTKLFVGRNNRRAILRLGEVLCKIVRRECDLKHGPTRYYQNAQVSLAHTHVSPSPRMWHFLVVMVVNLDDMFSENIWFSCPKSSNNWEKLRCHACDILTKSGKKGSILFENNPQKPPCPWLLCYSV